MDFLQCTRLDVEEVPQALACLVCQFAHLVSMRPAAWARRPATAQHAGRVAGAEASLLDAVGRLLGLAPHATTHVLHCPCGGDTGVNRTPLDAEAALQAPVRAVILFALLDSMHPAAMARRPASASLAGTSAGEESMLLDVASRLRVHAPHARTFALKVCITSC